MTDPAVPVGFDYSAALLRIRGKRTYAEIAEYCGYEDGSAISKIIQGDREPSHKRGEAIWVLYLELFGEKPPRSHAQAAGHYDIAESPIRESTTGI